MKVFLKTLILFLACLILVQAGLCAFIDPFNVFHPLNIRDNGVEPDKNYIKTSYILANPDKFDSFIFGSSRVGNIHGERIEGEKCYNMTYSQGTPQENLESIRVMLDAGIVPEHIYIGLDASSYYFDTEEHLSSCLQSPYDYSVSHPVRFWAKYFNPAACGNSLFTSLEYRISGNHMNSDFTGTFYDYGWNYDYGYDGGYDFDVSANPPGKCRAEMVSRLDAIDYSEAENFGNMRASLDAIRETVRLCEENGIELTFFTNPLYYSLFAEAVCDNYYFYFLEKLAEITPFYNFSGFNDVTTDTSFYIEESHYSAEASDLVIDGICLGNTDENLLSQGFGVYVTEDSVSSLIELLSANADFRI